MTLVSFQIKDAACPVEAAIKNEAHNLKAARYAYVFPPLMIPSLSRIFIQKKAAALYFKSAAALC